MTSTPPAANIGPARDLDLGRLGAWRRGSDLTIEMASALEDVGYGIIWVGGSPGSDLAQIEDLLTATDRVTVASAIVNVWANDAVELARSYWRITDRVGERLLLGVGAGHPERAGTAALTSLDAVSSFLDVLDDLGVPRNRIILGALGPRALRLAAQRTSGAHTYLVTPTHTREARTVVGPGPIVAVEQKVCLTDDPNLARNRARAELADSYLRMTNYRASLLREGFSSAELDGPADRLLDLLVRHGDPRSVAAQLRGHLEAGADHVGIQLLDLPGQDPIRAYREIATELQVRKRSGALNPHRAHPARPRSTGTRSM